MTEKLQAGYMPHSVKSKKKVAHLKSKVKAGESVVPDVSDTFNFIGNKRLELNLTNQEVQSKSQKKPFKFDWVFRPEHGQDNVFDEVQEVVKSALDGNKVCIFAYG